MLVLVNVCMRGDTEMHCCAAVFLAAAIAIAGTIQQNDLADAIYGDGVSTGGLFSPLLTQYCSGSHDVLWTIILLILHA